MWLLWVLAGCTGPDVEPEQCLPTVPEDPCAEVDCIDVCGTPFARGSGPAVLGWEVVEVPHPDASEVTRIGGVAVSVDGIALRTFADADLSPLGVLGPLDAPGAVGPAGDGVVVQVGEGVLVWVALADPEHPVATAAWHPLERLSEEDRVIVRVAGTWRDRIVLRIDASATVAIVDFSDPEAPAVHACLHDGPPVAWRVSTDGALTTIDLPDPAQPRALLPAGDHLALIDHNGRHRLMSRDGAVIGELSGVPMEEAAQFAASAAGVFTSDLEHGVYLVDDP